jgi:membrane fusion protein, multidrug efflux system
MATTLRPDTAPTADTDSDVPAPRTGSKRPFLILGILVLALAAWGLRTWLFARSHVTTDNAQVEGHVTPVAPKVGGFVARVFVDDNQPVEAGDTLVLLDGRDWQVRLQQAEADLAVARAMAGSRSRAGQAQAQLAANRATAGSAEANIASAEAALRKAAADVARVRGLAGQRIVSAQQLDAAEAVYSVAQANLDAARRQAGAADEQVTAATAALRGADARLAAAEAAVENARLQLSYTAIVAPARGIVATRKVEPGELVQPGQTLLAVVPLHDVWVTANLKETQMEDVSSGDAATFTVDAYPGKTFRGVVESMSPATGARFALLPPDNATGNFTKVVQRVPVRIALDGEPDPAFPLRPGLSAEVTIRTH